MKSMADMVRSAPTTLEGLMDVVERDFPSDRGWTWLLRSNGGSSYFANICKADGRVRFPVYGTSRFDALLGAYASASAGQPEEAHHG